MEEQETHEAKRTFTPDSKQQSVIDFNSGYAVVLAAAGCGKTECLSMRVQKAHECYGIAYSDMLCVTFTNRASRAMKDKVAEVVGGEALENLFVGNLHRFCINFLHDNKIISDDTGVIDELDQAGLIAEILGAPTSDIPAREVKKVTDYACRMTEQEMGIPTGLFLHSDADYRYYEAAMAYRKTKQETDVIDFDDLLLMTYHAFSKPDYRKRYTHSSYRWIQVDEVQDLNPMQMAIIDKLTAKDFTSVVYLGDERQSIYSFLGTKSDSVYALAERLHSPVIHLSTNYRSPAYLLDMLNDYAIEQLGASAERLPTAISGQHIDDGLTTVNCFDKKEMLSMAVALANTFQASKPNESIGILTRTNDDADKISDILGEHGLRHAKLTKRDMFKSVDFKTIYSHFAVTTADTRLTEWARILFQTKAVSQMSLAHRCVAKMRQLGITPADLMEYADSTYLMEFAKAYEGKEIVIFDTETTGLNIFEDDIIQIAALKIRNGAVVPGSEIDIIIETDKQIPATLKNGIVNPMIEEYARRKAGVRNTPFEHFMPADEALAMFVDYVGDDDLLGHNVNFDIHILENNLRRRTTSVTFSTPAYWDTLKMARLLHPELKRFNLEFLLKKLGLSGVNSHNAFDDIRATKSLTDHCHECEIGLMAAQRQFISHKVMKEIQAKMVSDYRPIYLHSKAKLYSPEVDADHTFDSEFTYVHDTFARRGIINAIEHIDYMRALFNRVVIDTERDRYFNHQVVNHLHEFRTFNEGDLYQNGIIGERIHVMTIHKAKGLEFDNVILHDISAHSIPRDTCRDMSEDARLLYVGMSRAKKRLYLTYVGHLSPFIEGHDKVGEHFIDMTESQKDEVSGLTGGK